MSWFKIDDKMHEDEKQNGAGITAVGLWTMCGSWAADNWSDGYVPRRVAARFIPRSMKLDGVAERLVQAGMWVAADDGWMIVNFLKYNRSRAQRDADRAAAAERMRTKREGRTSPEEPLKNPRRTPEDAPKVRRKTRSVQVRDDAFARSSPLPVPEPVQEQPSVVLGSPATPSRGLAVVRDVDLVPTVNAGDLVGAWIDHRGGVTPTPQVLGQVSRTLRQLVDAKIPADVIYQGLITWQESGYAPSALSSFVDRALVAPTGVSVPKKIGSRTDQMWQESLPVLEWAREMDAQMDAKAKGELA